MSFIDWVIEAADEVIDAFFIQPDLVDVNLTNAELTEIAALYELTNETEKRAMSRLSHANQEASHLYLALGLT